MKKVALTASKRTLYGRKVKKIRKLGSVPANVFGKKMQSQAITVITDDFAKAFSEAGETTVILLDVEGTAIPVLVKKIQVHPLTGAYVHVDFLAVDLTQKVKANVPVKMTGVSPAIINSLGVLLELTDEIEVEALPADLPEQITIDIATLDRVGSAILIKDLVAPGGVTILTAKDTELVKIGELISKEAEEQAKADADAAAAKQAEAATQVPGKVTPQVETEPTENKKEEKKSQ